MAKTKKPSPSSTPMGLIPEVRSRALGERLLRRNVGLRPTVTAAPPPGAPARPIDSMAAAKVKEMKSEGNKLFAQREYAKAMQQYEDAMKMLPDGASERADFLCNKGACLYSQQKLKEAVKEYTAALELDPNSSKALRHRAKALERSGQYKAALADVMAVNRTDSATDETREAERRLRDLAAGRRPSLANGGGARAVGPAGRGAPARGGAPAWPFSAKLTLGAETRAAPLSAAAGYADLLTAFQAKFPDAGPVVLKYMDRDNDLVTITSRHDVQAALAEALRGMDRRLGVVPPIRVTATPVSSKADVPPVPVDELQEGMAAIAAAQQRQEQLRAAAAATAAAQAPAKQLAQTPTGEVVEIEDWLLDFAGMFRDATGIDAERHIDPHNEGWALTNRAMEATLSSKEAEPLFDRAVERFQEVIAIGYVNWGNVAICRGHRVLDTTAAAGKPLDDALAAEVAAQFDAGEARFKQALDVRPGLFDTLSAFANLEADRAKLAARVLLPPPPAAPEGGADGDAEAASKAASEAHTQATRAALAGLTPALIDAAQAHIDAACEWHRRAHAAAVATDEARKAAAEERSTKAGSGPDAPAQQQPEGEMSLPGHARVLHGNTLYEWSQLLAAAGRPWKPLLDEAVAAFREAGCAETDIRGALKAHTHADELDLGPDPEPEAPAATAAGGASGKAPPPEAKGLPKLERKPKATNGADAKA